MYSIKRFSQMTEQKEFNSKAQKALRATYDKMKALKDADNKNIIKEIERRTKWDSIKSGMSNSKDSLTDRALKSVGRSSNRKGRLVRSDVKLANNRLSVHDSVEQFDVPTYGSLNNKINAKGRLDSIRLRELKSAEELASKGGGKGALNKIKMHLSNADDFSSRIKEMNKYKVD